MADGFVFRGLWNRTIRIPLKEVMKSVHLENVSQMVSRIFTPVDASIIYTFLLLYVHFSFDAAFIELHFLD